MNELNLTIDEYGGVKYPNEAELMNKINEIVRWINSRKRPTSMTTPMGTLKCCTKCASFHINTGEYQGCVIKDCDCHTPTPNTGTEEWELDLRALMDNGVLEQQDELLDAVRSIVSSQRSKTLATQKSQIIAEVEGIKVQVQELKDAGSFENAMRLALTSHGSKCYNLAIDAVITKLKGV